MEYFTIFVLVIAGLLFGMKQKSYLNFVSIFCYYWAFIVFLASLRLYGMMEYSNTPFYLILIGTLGMFMGYIIRYYSKLPHISLKRNKKNDVNSETYNNSVIMCLALLCMAFYAFELLRVVQLLRAGNSYYFIRRMYQGYEESTFFTSAIESYFSSYIAVPSAYILSSYLIIILFRRGRKGKEFFFALVAVSLYLIVSASRYVFIQLLIGTVYLFFLLKKKVPKKVKRWIKRVSVLLIIGVIALTLLRENKTSSGARYNWTLLQSVYSYFSIPIPLMDYWVSTIETTGYQAHGLVFFRPFLSIFTLFVLHPLGIEFNALNEAIDKINLVENFVQVFPRHQYNAFASMFYYFYLDFKWIGVFLGSAFWGWICANTFKKVRFNPSDRNLAFVLVIMQAMFKTMVRWEFSAPSFFVASVLTFFLFGGTTKTRYSF